MGQKYKQLKDGEVRIVRGRRGQFAQKVMCCDCGLVHVFAYVVRSPRRMEFSGWRDNRATAARRRPR